MQSGSGISANKNVRQLIKRSLFPYLMFISLFRSSQLGENHLTNDSRSGENATIFTLFEFVFILCRRVHGSHFQLKYLPNQKWDGIRKHDYRLINTILIELHDDAVKLKCNFAELNWIQFTILLKLYCSLFDDAMNSKRVTKNNLCTFGFKCFAIETNECGCHDATQWQRHESHLKLITCHMCINQLHCKCAVVQLNSRNPIEIHCSARKKRRTIKHEMNVNNSVHRTTDSVRWES